MVEKGESTQSLKTESTESNFWEESLPIPDLPEVGKLKLVKSKLEIPQVEKPSPVPPKRFFIFTIANLRIILAGFLLIVLLVVVILIFAFFGFKTEELPNVQTLLPPTPTPVTLFRRISSAFVPKVPSTEAAELWVNWVKFEDKKLGIAFFYPEEWQVVLGDSGAPLTLYYPVVDEREENFGKTVAAKLRIFTNQPQADLAQFLLKRYNFFNVNLEELSLKDGKGILVKFDNNFILGMTGKTKTLILEGKVGKSNEFENFLPIFLNISTSLKISE